MQSHNLRYRLLTKVSVDISVHLFSYVQTFHFFSGPRGSSQKDQAGLNAGVFCEAAYPDSSRHLFPSVFFNQTRDDHLKGDAMKRIFMLIIGHFVYLWYFLKTGGGGRIRTHGGLTPTTAFKAAAIDHSATPPIYYTLTLVNRPERPLLYAWTRGTKF